MKDFFKSLREVDVAQQFYKRLALSCIVALVVVVVSAFAFAYSAVDKERNSLYTLDVEGNLLRMSRSTVYEKRPVEAAAHVRLLLTYLFEVDKLTYKNKLTRAYNLGNKSIYAIYAELESTGWYKDVEQFNARSTLVVSELQVAASSAPYQIRAVFSVIINSDITTNQRYDLDWDITVENGNVERTEDNPHNMIVTQIVKRKFEEAKQ